MEREAAEPLEEVDQLMKAELWQQALDAITREPTILERSKKLLWNAGWAHYKLSEFAEAVEYLRRACELAPDDPISRWAAGLALMELEQAADAEKELLRSVALKDSYDGRLSLAYLYQKTGDRRLAEAVHREGIRLRPDHRERLEALADFLSDVGRDEEASAIGLQAKKLPTREERRRQRATKFAVRSGTLVGLNACKGSILRFDEPHGTRAVVIEDDGRVAYSYLLDEDGVVGDVWLYNVADTPDLVDWRDRSQLPFVNPKKFCMQEEVPRIGATSEVHCDWSTKGVDISIDGVKMARLEHGSKPGWSRLAACDGPLAKPLIADMISVNSIKQAVSRLMEAEKWEDACKLLDAHRELVRSSVDLTWDFGSAFFKLDEFSQAIPQFEHAVTLKPSDALARWALGEAYGKVNRLDEAERELLRAIALRDGYQARRALGFLYHRTGRLLEAEAIYREGIRLRPTDPKRVGTFADFLEDVGRSEEAKGYYQSADELMDKAGRTPPASTP